MRHRRLSRPQAGRQGDRMRRREFILNLSGAATVEAAPPRADLKAAAPGPRLIAAETNADPVNQTSSAFPAAQRGAKRKGAQQKGGVIRCCQSLRPAQLGLMSAGDAVVRQTPARNAII